ncbi:hypothetical protein [Fuchsiella alkaliacetigena]|uniref:hypothetical protein n=1 Tax=Fuchsiella alkaliacetigena TaxID=957042 RepID=UPI00200A338F|nr:hypothetical protein [Fuchsiella alkaliacetigena]MCK8823579.1 hypothetical protein [Fuchsiella alkaliacetigena]
MNDLLFAFLLTLFAGLSTGIGSALAFFTKKTNTSFLATSLVCSREIMIYISTDELLPTSRKYGEGHQEIYGFVAGMGVMAISLLLLG